MHVLLHIEVTRKPRVIVPVTHLIMHVRPVGLTFLLPDCTSVIVGIKRVHLTDIAAVNALHHRAKAVAVAQTQTTHYAEALLARQLAGL